MSDGQASTGLVSCSTSTGAVLPAGEHSWGLWLHRMKDFVSLRGEAAVRGTTNLSLNDPGSSPAASTQLRVLSLIGRGGHGGSVLGDAIAGSRLVVLLQRQQARKHEQCGEKCRNDRVLGDLAEPLEGRHR